MHRAGSKAVLLKLHKLCNDGSTNDAIRALLSTDWQVLNTCQGIFRDVLKACLRKKDIQSAKQIHVLIDRIGLSSTAELGDLLVRLYASCGNLPEASNAFWKIEKPGVHAWNAILGAHAKLGNGTKALDVYQTMHQRGVVADVVTFLHVLKACANAHNGLIQGRLTHDQAIRHDMDMTVVGNSLIYMYAKQGSLVESKRVFDCLTTRTVVSWGALMTGYVENEQYWSALELFKDVKKQDVEPNRVVYICIIKSCMNIGTIHEGRLVHGLIIRDGVDFEVMVGNSLIDMYAKFGDSADASRIFIKLPNKDVASWDAQLSGLIQNGHGLLAIELFGKMLVEGLQLNEYTFSCILKACSRECTVVQGKIVHDLVVRCSFDLNIVVGNSLLEMYAKCGCLEDAFVVFDHLHEQDVVSWGTMIARCAEQEKYTSAIELFESMLEKGAVPNKAIFICVLKACILGGSLVEGRMLHDQTIQNGMEIDVTIGSTLVDMYSRNGNLEEASKIFFYLKSHSEAPWGLMISGYVQHGHHLLGISLFEEMQEKDIKADKVSLLSMIKVCSRMGAITQGRIIHEQVLKRNFDSDVEVQSAIIDMYAKCGGVNEAQKVLGQCPNRNAVSWGSLVAGLARYGYCELAWKSVGVMQTQGLVLDSVILTNMLNAYCNAGLLGEGCMFFTSMIQAYGITPRIEDYNSMVDLFARTGRLRGAEDLLRCMPHLTDIVGWMALLSCCKIHNDIDLARRCFNQIIHLHPEDASCYLLMSSIYADAGMWESLEYIQALQVQNGVAKKPGIASIEVNHTTYEFVVGYKSQLHQSEIVAKFGRVNFETKCHGCVPQVDLILEQSSTESAVLNHPL